MRRKLHKLVSIKSIWRWQCCRHCKLSWAIAEASLSSTGRFLAHSSLQHMHPASQTKRLNLTNPALTKMFVTMSDLVRSTSTYAPRNLQNNKSSSRLVGTLWYSLTAWPPKFTTCPKEPLPRVPTKRADIFRRSNEKVHQARIATSSCFNSGLGSRVTNLNQDVHAWSVSDRQMRSWFR